MKKALRTVFIIPGFRHSISEPAYRKVRRIFASYGFRTLGVPITWKRRVMSDYIQDFLRFYELHRVEGAYVLGFSYGAMIAYLAAPYAKPHALLLCSLSPYFKEDLPYLPRTWKDRKGMKRQFIDFIHHSFDRDAIRIRSKCFLFLGEKEARRYSSLARRVEDAHSKLKGSELIIVPNAEHNLGAREYIEAIQKIVLHLL